MNGASVSIDMCEEAKNRLNGIWQRYGMTQRSCLLRILTWFDEQEEMAQALVLGQVPDDYVDDVIDLLHSRRHEPPDAAKGGDAAEQVVDDALGQAAKTKPTKKPRRKRGA